MALVVKDRVLETTTTTGTGTLTLGGAVTGYQSFSSAIGNANTTYYSIANGSEWEVGLGTVSAGQLSRDTVLESSNAGSLVNFSAGTKQVFCTYPAERAVLTDSLGALATQGDGDKGDITVSASGSTWTIDNDAVTFAKMQNIATARLLGRSTASSGDVEELSLGSGLSLTAGVLSSSGGATGAGGDEVFIENEVVVTTNYTLSAGKNAMSTGPITVNGGVVVTIPLGARWVIL